MITASCLESSDLQSQVFNSCLGLFRLLPWVRKMEKFLQGTVTVYTQLRIVDDVCLEKVKIKLQS